MKTAESRVFTATVVAIVAPETRDTVVETCGTLADAGVRSVVIRLGTAREASRREEHGTILIDGLLPKYLDNAVASLRLSSLPTVAWCRAGDPETLEELADLVDRMILDLEDPSDVWAAVPAIASRAPVGDLRWTRLTRWRDLMAQFFDVPEVRASAEEFTRVEIAGSDRHDARLFGGWLQARLPARDRIDAVIQPVDGLPLQSVHLSGAGRSLSIRLLDSGTCLETSIGPDADASSSRVVPLGDQHPLTLLAEELRVRSRDLAFEDAVRKAVQL